VIRGLAALFVGTLTFWAIVAYPAYRLASIKGLLNSAVAATLCFLPAAMTLIWSQWTLTEKPERGPTSMLAASGIRMGIVLGSGLLLVLLNPDFKEASFWLSVLVFYLFTLALEMLLLVTGWSRATS
jgi:hypothetical protein